MEQSATERGNNVHQICLHWILSIYLSDWVSNAVSTLTTTIASEMIHIRSTIRIPITVKDLSTFRNPMTVHPEEYRVAEDYVNVLKSGRLVDVS